MKLTWFGGSAMRVYVGGQVVVVDPEDAPDKVDRGELLAGADRIVARADALPEVDLERWRSKPVPRMMEEVSPLEVLRTVAMNVLVAAAGEPPLLIVGKGGLPVAGRWAEGAVLVLTAKSQGLAAEVTSLLDRARPRLIGLAMNESGLQRLIDELAPHLDGTALVSLEPGLAVEV